MTQSNSHTLLLLLPLLALLHWPAEEEAAAVAGQCNVFNIQMWPFVYSSIRYSSIRYSSIRYSLFFAGRMRKFRIFRKWLLLLSLVLLLLFWHGFVVVFCFDRHDLLMGAHSHDSLLSLSLQWYCVSNCFECARRGQFHHDDEPFRRVLSRRSSPTNAHRLTICVC